MTVYIAQSDICENGCVGNSHVIGVYSTMHKCVENAKKYAHSVAYDRGYCGKKRPAMNVNVDPETLNHEVHLTMNRKMYGYMDSNIDIIVSCYPMTVE